MKYDITPPVKVGQRFDVDIIALGSEGDGIAKIEKYIIFIPGTEVGQRYRVEITNALARNAFAKVVEG